MDQCPACSAETNGTRFCRMCGAPLLADVLVDTAAGQAARSRSESAATVPVVLPEQFESLFRPRHRPLPMDATQPMSVLPVDVAGLPPAPPSPIPFEEIDEPGGRRRLFALAGAGAALLVAGIVVIAVMLLGNSGPAASGKPNTPDLTTTSSSSVTAPAAAANLPAVNPTTAATSASRHAASSTASAPATTAKSTPTKAASTWPGNLSIGSHGPRVRQVQEALQRLRLSYGGVTGDYDTSTAVSVAFFQRSQGLRTTGTVDQTTWNALMKAAG